MKRDFGRVSVGYTLPRRVSLSILLVVVVFFLGGLHFSIAQARTAESQTAKFATTQSQTVASAVQLSQVRSSHSDDDDCGNNGGNGLPPRCNYVEECGTGMDCDRNQHGENELLEWTDLCDLFDGSYCFTDWEWTGVPC